MYQIRALQDQSLRVANIGAYHTVLAFPCLANYLHKHGGKLYYVYYNIKSTLKRRDRILLILIILEESSW